MDIHMAKDLNKGVSAICWLRFQNIALAGASKFIDFSKSENNKTRNNKIYK